jgi:signal peptidase I
MEPSFHRGDILFLWLGNSTFAAGEVVVFKIDGRDIPIVHRAIQVHQKCGHVLRPDGADGAGT